MFREAENKFQIFFILSKFDWLKFDSRLMCCLRSFACWVPLIIEFGEFEIEKTMKTE